MLHIAILVPACGMRGRRVSMMLLLLGWLLPAWLLLLRCKLLPLPLLLLWLLPLPLLRRVLLLLLLPLPALPLLAVLLLLLLPRLFLLLFLLRLAQELLQQCEYADKYACHGTQA